MTSRTDTQVSAEACAERLLANLGPRWAHVCGVAARSAALDLPDVLVTAAWLHDVGYAEDLRETGMHAIDGARYLQREGWPDVIVRLVAWHTGADSEATERGLTDQLEAFPRPPDDLGDALTLCDLTVSPTGQDISIPDRLAEIVSRYPAGHPVHRSVTRSQDDLVLACRRAMGRLGLAEGWGLTAVQGVPDP